MERDERVIVSCGLAVSVGAVLLVAACGGVPSTVVEREASMIKKNAVAAQALLARCIDGGADASPEATSAVCAAELQALTDIQGNAAALLKAAGASDAGGQP